MMNRKNMTASPLDETALDAYYTLTEGGANYGIGLALAATLNSLKNRNTSSPVRIDEDTMDAYLAVSEGFDSMGLGLAAMLETHCMLRSGTQQHFGHSNSPLQHKTGFPAATGKPVLSFSVVTAPDMSQC